MSRTPWVCTGYEWPVNPYEDSGWVVERAYQEHQPIQGRKSVIFSIGFRSTRRKISGYIIGPKAQEFYNKWIEWFQRSSPLTLTDHHGITKRCILVSFSPSLIRDIHSFRQGTPVYHYTAEFVSTENLT